MTYKKASELISSLLEDLEGCDDSFTTEEFGYGYIQEAISNLKKLKDSLKPISEEIIIKGDEKTDMDEEDKNIIARELLRMISREAYDLPDELGGGEQK